MVRTYVEIREKLLAAVRDEEGSEVTQAAGVAILATALIGAMLALSGDLSDAVTTAFENLAGAIGG